jgi:hypothetical protein
MGGKRMIITLPEEDKAWLATYGRIHHISAAEAVRMAIQQLKNGSSMDSCQTLLDRTRGLWKNGDGLKYQEEIRSEWHSK